MIYNWQFMEIGLAFVTDANGKIYKEGEESKFQQVDTETGVCIRLSSNHSCWEVDHIAAPLFVHFEGDAESQKAQHDLVRKYNSQKDFILPRDFHKRSRGSAIDTTSIRNEQFRTFAPMIVIDDPVVLDRCASPEEVKEWMNKVVPYKV